MINGLCLFSVREASRGFIISLRASNRYKETYLEALERSLAFLSEFAERQHWPAVSELTTSHLEEYVASFATREKWFGERGPKGTRLSQSYDETQYRRLTRFFNWLKVRNHIEKNPLDLIPHPKIDERVIPTVSDREVDVLLKLVDPKLFHTSASRFRAIRDRAMLIMLIDTPGRKSEFGGLKTDDVDIDGGRILVMGKGGRERWMHLGNVAVEALWEYLQARAQRARGSALWVDIGGKPMDPDWLRRMLVRRGKDAGIPNLHPHRFRHTFAVKWLEADLGERILEIEGGWKRIPDTYFRTLGEQHAAEAHRRMSPADRLAQRTNGRYDGREVSHKKARGRL